MLPLVYTPAWLAASAILIVAMVYGSLGTGSSLPSPGEFDKLAHFSAYLFLAVWFTGLVTRAHYWKVVLALVCFGLAMEILQQMMQRGRYGDPFDMAANALGVAAGLSLALWQTGGWARWIDAWLARRRT
jgi:VanZ family protein